MYYKIISSGLDKPLHEEPKSFRTLYPEAYKFPLEHMSQFAPQEYPDRRVLPVEQDMSMQEINDFVNRYL